MKEIDIVRITNTKILEKYSLDKLEGTIVFLGMDKKGKPSGATIEFLHPGTEEWILFDCKVDDFKVIQESKIN